jgi:tRNA dimethylallyltransferase
MGPTASGKTAVALALAERFPVEIVSVDSAQVYRHMDVGTAKPDKAARGRVPHHLVDIVEPTDAYSVGRFREDSLAAARAIHARGRIPVFAGGTMLYFRALTQGLADLPRAQPGVRAELEGRAAREGWPRLHAELATVDPASAARIDPNDAQRIQRALEVHRMTGRPLSDLQQESPDPGTGLEALQISLEPSDRAVLHGRIGERFEAMLEAGLVREVRDLRSRYALEATLPSMRAVGYRQVWDTLEGREELSTLAARGTAATRQLAKRQLTWLRSWSGVERFDCLRPDLAAAVARRTEEFLSLPRGT